MLGSNVKTFGVSSFQGCSWKEPRFNLTLVFHIRWYQELNSSTCVFMFKTDPKTSSIFISQLVGGLVAINFIFPLILGCFIIIPIDVHSNLFQRGFFPWPTNQSRFGLHLSPWKIHWIPEIFSAAAAALPPRSSGCSVPSLYSQRPPVRGSLGEWSMFGIFGGRDSGTT